ncbi:hypothetical protein U1Q18_049243 [Sarracenia purpurea var. burkii]
MSPPVAIGRYFRQTTKGLDLEHAKLEAQVLMETSRRNIESCRKMTMERNSIATILKSRDQSLGLLKGEVDVLRAELEREKSKREIERAEFEIKVNERIE